MVPKGSSKVGVNDGRSEDAPIRVGVLWLGRVSEDTGGRTYLQEVLGPLAHQPGLLIDVHLGDRQFDVPAGCRPVFHYVPRQLGSVGRVLMEPFVAVRAMRNYDVVLAPFNNVPPMWRGPVVVVQHNVLAFGHRVQDEVGRLRGWYRPFALALSLRRATKVLTVSHYLRRLLLESFPDLDPARVEVAPLGAPSRTLEPGVRPTRDTIQRLLVVSALWPYKRVDQAIETLAALGEADAHLQVAGPGAPEERAALEALAERLGVLDRVEFLGNVPYDRLSELYASADVLLYLSEVESFGLPVLEAMAVGLPVVARRIEGLAEIGGDGPVWVAPDAEVGEVIAALAHLQSDDEFRAERLRAGRMRAAGFTWERTAALTAAALRAAVAEHAAARAT